MIIKASDPWFNAKDLKTNLPKPKIKWGQGGTNMTLEAQMSIIHAELRKTNALLRQIITLLTPKERGD